MLIYWQDKLKGKVTKMDEQNSEVRRGRGRPRKYEASVTETSKRSRRLSRPSSPATYLVILVLLAAIATSGYFYMKYRNTQNKLNNPTAAAQNETVSLVNKVSKLIELPSGETPTVATVSDVSKLSGQTFFEGAKNGDKVLIYSKAKTAILYRPLTNKVINKAPLNVNNTQSTTGKTGQ